MYILDSHMALHGACEVAESTATLNAKQSNVDRDVEGSAEHCFSKAQPTSDVERQVASEHARAVISSAQWPPPPSSDAERNARQKPRLCVVFECCRSSNLFGVSKAHGGFEERIQLLLMYIHIYIYYIYQSVQVHPMREICSTLR